MNDDLPPAPPEPEDEETTTNVEPHPADVEVFGGQHTMLEGLALAIARYRETWSALRIVRADRRQIAEREVELSNQLRLAKDKVSHELARAAGANDPTFDIFGRRRREYSRPTRLHPKYEPVRKETPSENDE